MTKSRVVAATVLILSALTMPAIAQDDLTDAQYAELSRALDMPVEEIRAMDLAPDDLQILLEGYTQAIVVVGSRAEARTITASTVPVDILSTSDLTRQGVFNLQEQLRTVVPSFNVNTQPISDASTVVRPAMLRNLAPDHTLVLVNGKRRHRSAIIDWHGGNGVAFGSQGPGISAIPAIALRQVEVLRDGVLPSDSCSYFREASGIGSKAHSSIMQKNARAEHERLCRVYIYRPLGDRRGSIP